MSFFNKTPQDRIRKAEKKKQKLRSQRANVDEGSKKFWKINNKIHEQKVEIDIARRELKQPQFNVDNSSKSLNFINNTNKLGLEGHIHFPRKKK